MIKRILALLAVFLFLSCSKEPTYPQYRYHADWIIPDSSRNSQREWITKSIVATDQHLTTSDYEDPEDVIYALKQISFDLYKQRSEGLYVLKDEYDGTFVPFESLTSYEKQIFIKLKPR